MTYNLKKFSNNTELVSEFADEIIARLLEGIKLRGTASLVVSGGSTPKTLFQHLSQQDIAWHKVTVTLADERAVAVDSSDSNDRLLKEHLLQNHATQAQFISLYAGEETAHEAAINAASRLSALGTYDVVILGMGEDGHTASLFPEASNLSAALSPDSDVCVAIDPVTNPMHRVSQSAYRLLDTRYIAFHLVGESKQVTLDKVVASGDALEYPSAFFLAQENAVQESASGQCVPVDVFYALEK